MLPACYWTGPIREGKRAGGSFWLLAYGFVMKKPNQNKTKTYENQMEESGIKRSFEIRESPRLTWLSGGDYNTEFSKSAFMPAKCQALWQVEKKMD